MTDISQRQLQVGEQIRRILAMHFFDELDTFGIKASGSSIMEVRMSADLKQAIVFVYSAQEDVLVALNDLASVFQKKIASQARLKFTPKLKFVADTALENAWHINTLLQKT